MREKIQAFIARYGYSLKAFAVSGLIFPPAALFIALKHPTWSRLQRAFALAGLVTFLAIIPVVGSATLAFVYELVHDGLSASTPDHDNSGKASRGK